MLLTDVDIEELILIPKMIVERMPAKGYKEENRHKRCNLVLHATSGEAKVFEVFIRQSDSFIENFSIGLRYQTGNKTVPIITLIRYNGPHGEPNRESDGHYARPHIHKITAEEIAAGSIQPQERYREITDRYATYEQALAVFFIDTAISNYGNHFSDLAQGRLL